MIWKKSEIRPRLKKKRLRRRSKHEENRKQLINGILNREEYTDLGIEKIII